MVSSPAQPPPPSPTFRNVGWPAGRFRLLNGTFLESRKQTSILVHRHGTSSDRNVRLRPRSALGCPVKGRRPDPAGTGPIVKDANGNTLGTMIGINGPSVIVLASASGASYVVNLNINTGAFVFVPYAANSPVSYVTNSFGVRPPKAP